MWSPVYVNALVLRDQSSEENGVLDQRLYVVQDANWNVTALVNTSGSVLECYTYEPYGAVTVLNASWSALGSSAYAMPYLWQGERYDWATGLYHTQTRDVSPTLQRAVEADPLGLTVGNNDYQWEGDHPISVVDPTGMDWLDPILGPVNGGWYSQTANAEVNGLNGVGDAVTFGGLRGVRQMSGNDNVDYNSGAYHIGSWVGTGILVVAAFTPYGQVYLLVGVAASVPGMYSSYQTYRAAGVDAESAFVVSTVGNLPILRS